MEELKTTDVSKENPQIMILEDKPEDSEPPKEKLTVAGMILGGLAIYFVTIFGISFLLGGIIASIFDLNTVEGTANYINTVGIISEALIIIWAGWLLKRHSYLNLTVPDDRKTLSQNLLWLIVILIAFLYAESILSVLIGGFLNAEGAVQQQSGIVIGGQQLLSILNVIVMAPLAEEIVCRGAVYGGIRRKLGVVPSVILGGIVFGLIHFNGWISLVMMFMGMVMCVVYEKTGSLIYTIILHMINNAVSMFSMYLGVGFIISENNVINIFLLVIASVITAFGCSKLKRAGSNQGGKER